MTKSSNLSVFSIFKLANVTISDHWIIFVTFNPDSVVVSRMPTEFNVTSVNRAIGIFQTVNNVIVMDMLMLVSQGLEIVSVVEIIRRERLVIGEFHQNLSMLTTFLNKIFYFIPFQLCRRSLR